MNGITEYPLALQLLMQTDGTVTELIELLTKEKLSVIKVSSDIEDKDNAQVLQRRIYLQGMQSQTYWLFAHSVIFLDNLPKEFVSDLIDKTIPIGTLWNDYRIETFKQVISKQAELSKSIEISGFKQGEELLSRTYEVYSQNKIIMQITEKFPIQSYESLNLLIS